MTLPAENIITLTGGFMKGFYVWDKSARRYCVKIYWQSATRRIYRYNGEPIWHEKTADKLLNKVRAEIDYAVAHDKPVRYLEA